MIISYPTGRDYGTPQILEITTARLPDDPFADMRVVFVDAARNIRGTVVIMALLCMSAGRINPAELGAAVLREYDAGRYTEV